MDNPDTNYANLASAILENAGYSSDSSITIPTTSSATFPTAPFYATIMPTTDLANSTNSEIVKVTSSSVSGTDTTFNITRAQRGTNAINWDAGKAVLVHAIYTQDVMAQSQGYYNAVLTGTNFDITNASAPTTPVVGSHMRVVFDTTVATATAMTITVNSGTAYPLKVGSAIYTQMTTLANMSITTGVVYELNFDGTNWVAQNTHAQITTNDIADGAVTSDKIDWATIYHIVVADGRAPRDGKFIEKIGTYNPMTNPAQIVLDIDSAVQWLKNGAQPSDTAKRILSYKGVLLKRHLQIGVEKGAISQEQADVKFNQWLQEKENKIANKRSSIENEARSNKKARFEAEQKANEAKAAAVAAKKAAAEAAAETEEVANDEENTTQE